MLYELMSMSNYCYVLMKIKYYWYELISMYNYRLLSMKMDYYSYYEELSVIINMN